MIRPQPLLLVRPIATYECEMGSFTNTWTAWCWKLGAMLVCTLIWAAGIWLVVREINP